MVVKVDPSRLADLSNTASVTSTTTDPTPGDHSATEATVVNTAADLSITKSDSPDPVLAGNNLSYTITVTNGGPSFARSVQVTDPVPAGTSFVSADNSGSNVAGTVTWNLGDLPAGTTVLHMVVKVDPSRLADLSNTASVTSTTTDPTPGDHSATETTGVNTAADLSITKSDSPDPVTAGNNLSYTITVTNGGPSFARSVQVTDPVPAGTSFVSADNSGSNVAGTVTWNLGDLPAGTTVLHMVVKVDPSRLADLSNTASVTSTTTDPTPGDHSATEATVVNTAADTADVKDAVSSVIAGNQITYTIHATNNGPSNAQNVVVTDGLDSHLNSPSYCLDSGSGCGLAATWMGSVNLGTLTPGQTVNVVITATVDASTPQGYNLQNTATISSTTDDPIPGNNSSSISTTVQTQADLSITKADSPDPVTAGNNLSYTITVTNGGPSFARSVQVTDPVPAGTSFVSADNSGSNVAGTVTWNLGDLPAGTTVLHMVVKVDPSRLADLSNTASVTSTTTDPTPGDHSATEATVVNTAADLSITKSDSPDPVTAGNNLSYTITVTNGGPSFARSVQVTDPVPAGTSFVSADNSGSNVAGTVIWSFPALRSANPVLHMVVKVDPSRLADLSNTATVTSTTADPTPGDHSATATTAVNTSADVAVTKDDGVSSVVAD